MQHGSPPGEGNARSGMTSSTYEAFYAYYAEASLSEAAFRRFVAQRDTLIELLAPPTGAPLDVLDLGCGAGTGTMLWAEMGHRAVGIDINEKLTYLASRRAAERGLDVRFALGSAHQLPFTDDAFDVCVAPELLEHVPDWRGCVTEIARTVKPGGIAFLSTTNVLCPIQQEFNLPLFSWYPRGLKRRFIQQAQTTRPELANYAIYPAVNWFSYYSLRKELRKQGFTQFWGRFEVMALRTHSRLKSRLARVIASTPITRFAGQLITPGTQIYARKEDA